MSSSPITKRKLGASGTMTLFEQVKRLQANGVDIVSLAAGELDVDSPESAKKAAIQAINENFTRYTISDGMPELRDAIAGKLSQETGQSFKQKQILVSNGCKQAIFNLLAALINRDDEVIIPTPFYPSHVRQVEMLGGNPVLVNTTAESGSQIDCAEIEKAVTPRSKLVIINSPHNPTGAVYNRETLGALADIVTSKNLWILSDEVYSGIVYPPAKQLLLLELFPELQDRLLIAGGFSKAFAMTGWRVGYAAGPESVIEQAGLIQSNTTTNVCSISQKAALAALQSEPHFVGKILDELKTKRDYGLEVINSIDGITCSHPDGAFYLFPSVEHFLGRNYGGSIMKSSGDISEYLLNEHSVAVVPGGAFGAEDHIRLTFAVGRASLEKGLSRLKKGLEQLE